jgi:hypothetical protein
MPLRAAVLFADASNSSGSSMVVRICHDYAIQERRAASSAILGDARPPRNAPT